MLNGGHIRCAAKGISVYSPHTSLDAAEDGINDWLAKGLGDGSWQSHPQRPRVWELAQPIDVEEAISRIKKRLDMPTVMFAKSHTGPKQISSIGICPGSGGSFLAGSQADMWWTGEMSHHEVLAQVAQGTHIVLCTHTATERPYLKAYLRAKLEETLNQVREKEKLDDEPYEVVMSEHEVEVLQFV